MFFLFFRETSHNQQQQQQNVYSSVHAYLQFSCEFLN